MMPGLLRSAFLSFSSILVAVPVLAGSWEKLAAVYEVPAPKELAPYAFLELSNLKTRARGGVQEISYTIPRELTGREVHIRATSTDGGKTFAGEGCVMNCTPADCKVRYPGLEIYLEEVRRYLQEKGVAGDELAARERVVRFFRGELIQGAPGAEAAFLGDPFGVIHIKK